MNAPVETFDPAELPKATSDWDKAKRDLDKFGYCLIEKALASEEVERLKSRLMAVAAAERADGTASLFDRDQSQAVNALLNKGKPFTDLVQHPLALEFMGYLLGEKFLLSNMAALIKGPGGPAQVVHADQGFMPEPWHFPCSANVMWMLDDFIEVRGATRVVPGSHLRNQNPPGGNFTKPEEMKTQKIKAPVAIEGPAGTAMVFEGRLWHCGGGNRTTDHFRHGLLTYYCKGMFRTQENWFRSLSPHVLKDASPTLMGLLGYEQYSVLGAVSR
jgi:ectoine hydroxylase-related dioxygenase (phytanoyl-CoA dioxygenase family)